MANCSRQCSFGSANEEIEILKAIYLDDINEEFSENGERSIMFTLKPNLEDGQSKQYRSIELEILIPADYPSSAVSVKLKKPRGITDEEVEALSSQIVSFIHQHKGQAILFDIIQVAQDLLSCSEVPKLPCSICLTIFDPVDEIFVTNVCNHHFHSCCIGRYIQHVLEEKKAERLLLAGLLKDTVSEEIGCPLCRCPMEYNLSNLLNAARPQNEHSEVIFDWTELSNPIQRYHNDLYQKQKEQGGLIDIDEDKKRFLITEDTRIVLPPSSSAASVNLGESSADVAQFCLDNKRGGDREMVRLDVKTGGNKHFKKKFYHPHHHTGSSNRECASSSGSSNPNNQHKSYNFRGNSRHLNCDRKQQSQNVASNSTVKADSVKNEQS